MCFCTLPWPIDGFVLLQAKTKKAPLQAMKSGSASDAEQSPVQYICHDSTPGEANAGDKEAADLPKKSVESSSTSADGAVAATDDQNGQAGDANVCRSGSDVSAQSVG